MIDERPEGIIITISQKMFKEKGYRNWLNNFLGWMEKDDAVYFFRTSNKPKIEIAHLYLCIGGRIRYRVNLVDILPAGEQQFSDGTKMYARCWLVVCGPVERPEFKISYKGRQGFRYTKKLF